MLRLTLALADRGAYDEFLQIIMDFVELIGGNTAGCQFHIDRVDSSKVTCSVSSSPSIIMTRIVGFYSLAMMIDLLPFLLAENLEKWADFSGICDLN